jgi:hypothetical protein
MKIEILVLSHKLELELHISRHTRGFKLYLPFAFIAVNDITPTPRESDILENVTTLLKPSARDDEPELCYCGEVTTRIGDAVTCGVCGWYQAYSV